MPRGFAHHWGRSYWTISPKDFFEWWFDTKHPKVIVTGRYDFYVWNEDKSLWKPVGHDHRTFAEDEAPENPPTWYEYVVDLGVFQEDGPAASGTVRRDIAKSIKKFLYEHRKWFNDRRECLHVSPPDVHDLPTHQGHVPFADGLYNWVTKTLKPYVAEDCVVRTTGYNYIPVTTDDEKIMKQGVEYLEKELASGNDVQVFLTYLILSALGFQQAMCGKPLLVHEGSYKFRFVCKHMFRQLMIETSPRMVWASKKWIERDSFDFQTRLVLAQTTEAPKLPNGVSLAADGFYMTGDGFFEPNSGKKITMQTGHNQWGVIVTASYHWLNDFYNTLVRDCNVKQSGEWDSFINIFAKDENSGVDRPDESFWQQFFCVLLRQYTD